MISWLRITGVFARLVDCRGLTTRVSILSGITAFLLFCHHWKKQHPVISITERNNTQPPTMYTLSQKCVKLAILAEHSSEDKWALEFFDNSQDTIQCIGTEWLDAEGDGSITWSTHKSGVGFSMNCANLSGDQAFIGTTYVTSTILYIELWHMCKHSNRNHKRTVFF